MEKLIELLNKTVSNVDFRKEKNLFSSGLLDSVSVATIIVALSEEYGIDITINDISRENFESVNAMYKLIQKKISDSKN
jgi:D-alanine--poly(phosphoribitol) ligase subunit 2